MFKRCLKKISKNPLSKPIFQKTLTIHASIFCAFGKNGKSWEILRKFSKTFKKFIKKIAKMHYFSIFFKEFKNHAINFCVFGRKIQILGKF